MAEREVCVFRFPVLLAPSPGSGGKYRALIQAYHRYRPSEREGEVSDLEEATLDAVRGRSRALKVPPGGTMEVVIYELTITRPPIGKTLGDMENAYQIVNDDYLKKNALPLPPRQGLNGMESENLIAVLHIGHPVPSTLQLPTMHEVNESDAQICREGVAAAAQKRDSPSAGASLTKRIATQKVTRVDAVYNYRPPDLIPPPIAIYHPVFAKFLQLMATPRDPTHGELELAHQFVCLSLAYYKDEAKRIEALSHHMRAAVHGDILVQKQLSYGSGQLTPDGVVSSKITPDGFSTIIAILEAKAEIGEGGSDPIAQAECAYVAIYSSDEARNIREACCCPALIIGMPGPNIIVSGAVFADKFTTQTLTDYISLIPRPNQNNRSPLDDAGYRVAHLFRALKECIGDLDTYYSQLVQVMSPPLVHPSATGASARAPVSTGTARTLTSRSFIGPHFTKYRDGEGKEVVLTYRARLQPHLHMKAVFVAEAKSESKTEEVVVKFAYKYNREAHELLASTEPSQAPKLRYCALEPSVGAWVIVMDYVGGSEVEADGVLKETVHIESLRAALKKLHGRGLVFGDLRSPNVLIVGNKVMLIDFDWCGEAGQARYPSDILIGEGTWHRGVQRGGLMDQAHDEYHFLKLTSNEL